MNYCHNPHCQKPLNYNGAEFCQSCGSSLLLKNRYRIIKLLGSGVLGRTFLAVDEDKPSKTRCIVKQIFPATSSYSIAKANSETFRVLTNVFDRISKHPQIPELLACFELNNHKYLVQEYIAGRNLAEELADIGPFEENKIRQLLEEILPVLEFIHNHQIIHGDIKPENIIRRQGDRCLVLVDFGTAILTSDSDTITHEILTGSAEYAAPEQIKGEIFTNSDIYSLGVTCIHLLTQISPFDLFDSINNIWIWRDYLNLLDTSEQNSNITNWKTPGISNTLGKIIDKMLLKSASDRYQTATEVIKDLKSWNIPQINPAQGKLAIASLAGSAIAILLAIFNSSIPSLYPVPDTSFTFPETSNSVTKSEEFKQFKPNWRKVYFLQTLPGMYGPIWSIAISPNGQTIATGSFEEIKIWHIDNGNKKTIKTPKSGPIWSVAIAPDGKTIASGSENQTIQLWDIKTGKLLQQLTGHTGGIFSVAFSADGKYLVSASEDKTIKLWSKTGELLHTFTGHSSEVQTVAFSPDSQIIATGGNDSKIKLWNVNTGELITTLKGHTEAVWSVAFSPDGKNLASGSWDNTIKMWDVNTGQQINTLIGHKNKVQSVAFSPDGKILATGDFKGTIKLWDADSGNILDTLKQHSAWVNLVFSPDGQTLASGSFDETIKLWGVYP